MAYTRIDAYRESLEFLDKAIEAMDQALSTMKDAKVSPEIGTPTYRQTAPALMRALVALRTNLATKTECDECGTPLPCSCAWLHEEVR